AHALADDVLAAAEAPGTALMALQQDRVVPRRNDERLPSCARSDAAQPLDRRHLVVCRCGLGRTILLAAQVRALTARGPGDCFRPRDRAPGLDAAIHRRSDQAD